MNLKTTHQDGEWNPKYYGVAVGLFCGLYMITMAIVPKLFSLEGFIFSVGIITFPLCCILTDLMTEVYGFNRARRAIWTVLCCNILFAVFTYGATLIPAAAIWPHEDAFDTIFSVSPRLALAGNCAWLAGEFVNSFIVSKMKVQHQARHMGIRFIASTVVGQFLDTLVFYAIAFIGIIPLKELAILVLSGWAFKIIYEIIALPLSVPAANWLKRREGIEHFDDRETLSVI
jgi:uncharacterized integral membrane protein (TIGR00697 family)